MTAAPQDTVCIMPPERERVILAFGDEVRIRLGATETAGKYTLFNVVSPPGGGPPPHVHVNEDEWFIVLEGRAEFFAAGAWNPVTIGTTIYVPKGTVHTYKNVGDTPLRMLVHISPAGFETFYSRCALEFAKPGPPDMARIVQIAGEHGIQFITP